MAKGKLPKNKVYLRKIADQLWVLACVKRWGQNCVVCERPAVDIHHFFPKGGFARLRYEIGNGVPLCRGCHMGIHFRGNPMINQQIIGKRGKYWYEKLTNQSKESFVSANTVKWYEENIAKLQTYLEQKKNPD